MNVEGKMTPGEVLMVLYNRAKTQGMGILQYAPQTMTLDEANASYNRGGPYFDYLHGRAMKINVGLPVLDTFLYNRDNGPAAAENALLEYLTAPK